MRTKLFLACALVALALPAAALAKGPSAATVTGPGIHRALALASKSGGDPAQGTPLWRLTIAAGFFPAVFVRSPDPMLRTRPKGTLGPRYTIVYTVPGPNGSTAKIRQLAFPFAKPNPLTFMRRGQQVWTGQTTWGGWYVSTPELRRVLVAAGMPRHV